MNKKFAWPLLLMISQLFLASVLYGTAAGNQLKTNENNSTVKVFILAGQSNAVGYNHLKEYSGNTEKLQNELHDLNNVIFWPGSNAKSTLANKWVKLQIGASGIADKEPFLNSCFGPEIGLGITLSQAMPGEEIAIIKYALGGTGIARSVDYSDYIPTLKGFDDKRSNWHPPGDGKNAGLLYSNLMENIKNGLAKLKQEKGKYEICGFIWMQGEHEAGINKKMAEDYETLLTLFRDAVRKDLNQKALPFAIGEINSHTWAFGDIARKKQKEACDEDLNSILIKTTDLPRGGTGGAAHFNADGMITLGNRFANGILQLLKNKNPAPIVSFESLLTEMGDPDNITRCPQIKYSSLQASSYNRASVSPDKPGWFADSDGISWIREEDNNGRKEYVIMEHDGPGCITRMWTPFFYYNYNNRIGPVVRIYLDGNKEPVINENFIALLTGKGSIKPPFTGYTARAGVCFLPIPFSKSCKITLDDKAFYNIINYRAYTKGTQVHRFSMEKYRKNDDLLASTAKNFVNAKLSDDVWHKSLQTTIKSSDSLIVDLPKGNHALQQLSLHIDLKNGLQCLRSTILKLNFDGQQTVWCPAGDFFCCPDTINPFVTRNLRVSEDGNMVCKWVMPYSSDAHLTMINLQGQEVTFSLRLEVNDRIWDDQSMYFHANWSDIGPLPGNHFFDMNFIDITGKGVLAGDALTVLSPGKGWWGEGDEKIYMDESDINRKFPSHFGTGTEDYYGWAGGVVPTGKDEFSKPFGANVQVGNPLNPRGYNICLRNRLLDDVPFNNRLVFDMEASPGVNIRNYWNLLSYSMVTYWYGMPGAISNRGPRPDLAKQKLISLSEIERMQQLLKDSIIIYQTEKVKNLVKGMNLLKSNE